MPVTRCIVCGNPNDLGTSVCATCGAGQVATCGQCGTQSAPAARFCGECGAALYPAGPALTGLRVAPRSGLAELKQATVFIADVVSSTELVSGLDAEEAMARLHPVVSLMCAIVERFDGTVVRTLGDGIMALFGAPRAHEGHALLACEAALVLQEQFRRQHPDTRIRIGLHSGEVVASQDAFDAAREQSVHGLTIHIASRVPALAEPGGTVLTEATCRLIHGYCEVESAGRFELKGIAEPVTIYRLLGLTPAIASEPFRGSHLTSLHGRERELAMLDDGLHATELGDARIIGVVGAPGTGKSRLCYEFANRCRQRGIPVFEARAQLYGHATPLQPVLEFMRALFFGIAPADDAASSRRKIALRLRELGPTFEAEHALLSEFLGVSDNIAAPLTLPPKSRRARLLDIIRHMVRFEGVETSVIIIEDLHWLDQASEDFVTTLVDAVIGTRTMLVLNYRSSESATWLDMPVIVQLPLTDLDRAEAQSLVLELVGSDPSLASLRERVAARSGGNPFFTEELVRSLAENTVIVGTPGHYAPGPRNTDDALPATVQAAISARIDRLPAADKAVLQTCAIIGKDVPLLVLADVAGLPLRGLEAHVDNLRRAELLHIHSVGDEKRCEFRHPLIQEVAYAAQLRSRRSPMHAAVAVALETHYRDRLDEYSALVAYHFEAANDPRKAAAYAARAATWVGAVHPAEAIKHWRKVRLLLQDRERSPDGDALSIMASGQIGWLGWREGLTAEEASPYLREALSLARETDDSMTPLLLFVEGRIIVASGGPADTYVDRVREALALLRPGRDEGRGATLKASLSHAYGWAGLLREALAANDDALRGLSSIAKFDHQFLGYSVEHWVVSLRGRILARLGREDEAQRCFDAMIDMGPRLYDPTVQIIAHYGCIDIAWRRGDAGLANRHAEEIERIADKHSSPYLRVFAHAGRGNALSVAHRHAEALEEFDAGVGFVRRTKAAMETEAEMLASSAECHYRVGDFPRAIAGAEEAIAVASERSARLPECRARIVLASALSRSDAARAGDAQANYAAAERLIAASGATIYEPLLARERAAAAIVAAPAR